MKLLIASSSDCKGGAARIAETLVRGLRNRGHEVCFLVERQDGSDVLSTLTKDVYSKPPFLTSTRLGRKVTHRLGLNALGLAGAFPGELHLDSGGLSNFDLIHLHDFAGLNLSRLPWLSRQLPVVWTIHSMQPLTGNCIYPFQCDRWKQKCGQCPQINEWPLNYLHRDASSTNLRLKKSWYRKSAIHAIGVSDWISDRVRESVMHCASIQTIQNAVDLDQFVPIDRSRARQQLGISNDDFAIAFSVASNPLDKRKGIDIVLQAAANLSVGKPVTFMPMSIGPATEQLSTLVSGSNRMLNPRHLSSPEELSVYYSAADVIWHPSRADTSSMVSMESMACGTPVIAATVGGVPEVIGDAGILITPESPSELVNATTRFAGDDQFRNSLIQETRKRVQELFSIDRFLDEHETFYRFISANDQHA